MRVGIKFEINEVSWMVERKRYFLLLHFLSGDLQLGIRDWDLVWVFRKRCWCWCSIDGFEVVGICSFERDGSLLRGGLPAK